MDLGVETFYYISIRKIPLFPCRRLDRYLSILSKRICHSNFIIHDEMGALVSKQHDMATAAMNAFS